MLDRAAAGHTDPLSSSRRVLAFLKSLCSEEDGIGCAAVFTSKGPKCKPKRSLSPSFIPLSAAIQDDVNARAGPTTWKVRREEIAALRKRVRAMRERHLGALGLIQSAADTRR